MNTTKFKTVEEYLKSQPKAIREILETVRTTIRKAAPEAEEVISYNMPGYKQQGMLVWFMAHTKHIGFYPGVSGISNFKKELSCYKSAKGSVQFPLDEPMPLTLISKIVRFRLKECKEKAKMKPGK
jgi:uncharacterized protein YdhG (YjbR/CyaY superfamily)